MDTFWENVDFSAATDFADASGFPTAILYGVIILLRHAAGPDAMARAAELIAPVLGAATIRRGLFAKKIQFGEPAVAQAAVSPEKLKLVFRQRIKPNRLRKLVDALETIPGAHDLELHGRQQRFAEFGSRGGAPLDG